MDLPRRLCDPSPYSIQYAFKFCWSHPGIPKKTRQFPRWRTDSWSKERKNRAAFALGSLDLNWNFIKSFVSIKTDTAEHTPSLSLIILKVTAEHTGLPVVAGALSSKAWCTVRACFAGWVGFEGGFSVLSSDCHTWIFPVVYICGILSPGRHAISFLRIA